MSMPAHMYSIYLCVCENRVHMCWHALCVCIYSIYSHIYIHTHRARQHSLMRA